MDESIFIHDFLVRRKMWTTDRIRRPIITITGSHQRTCVFGALCIDGRQFFRQYESFNQYTFLDYLIQMQRKFGKLILFIDRARHQHHRSIIVREYIEQNKDALKIMYFPKGSSEFNAIEECWRQGKYDLLVSKYYPNFANFIHNIANYYRTRRFKLDIVKYLSRIVS
jgi:transposase